MENEYGYRERALRLLLLAEDTEDVAIRSRLVGEAAHWHSLALLLELTVQVENRT